MSGAYQFALERKQALALVSCLAAAAVFMFFAGTITGMLLSNHRIVALTAENNARVARPPFPKEAELKSPPASVPSTASTHAAPEATPAAPTSAPEPINPPASVSSAQPAAQPSTQPAITNKESTAAPDASTGTTAAKAGPASISAANAGVQAMASAAEPPRSQAAPPSAPSAAPRDVDMSPAISLAVKVGSFTVKSNADALLASLSDLGYRPVMSRFTDNRGRRWYVVKLGPYARWNTASAVATRVSIAENVRPIIGPMQ